MSPITGIDYTRGMFSRKTVAVSSQGTKRDRFYESRYVIATPSHEQSLSDAQGIRINNE